MIYYTDTILSLAAIVFIDLILAGDNAIVIGMAARNLPKHLQGKAIFWGTAGAIIVRGVSAVIVVWLLKIPALMIIGGLLLLWIAYNLITEQNEEHNINAPSKLSEAVRTIVIADGIMGIDNVMGVAGAAHGNIILVIIGMLITVPIIIWGSTLFIKLIEKYPIIIYLGGAVLAWTSGSMLTGDPLIASVFENNKFKLFINIFLVIIVLGIAWFKNKKK